MRTEFKILINTSIWFILKQHFFVLETGYYCATHKISAKYREIVKVAWKNDRL